MTLLLTAALVLGGAIEARSVPAPAPLPPQKPPVYATSYNWQLGGINCDEDCSRVASGLFTAPELLGQVAACPTAWVGRPEYNDAYQVTAWRTTLVSFPGTDIEPRYCVDVFGHPRDRDLVYLPPSPYREGGMDVFRIDFAEEDPGAFGHNQKLLRHWITETVDVPLDWYAGQFQVASLESEEETTMNWTAAWTPDFEAELLAELKAQTGIEAGTLVRFVNVHPHAQKRGRVEGWEETPRGLRPVVVTDAGERIVVPRVDILSIIKEGEDDA